MSTMSVRPVEERDVPRICCFPQSEEELFYCAPKADFPLTPQQLFQAIGQRSDSTVVERGGEVVAFANFYRAETGGSCAVGNVVVAPGARGQGVGRCLLDHMVRLAFSKYQADEVIVSCFNSNIVGLLFYPALGFRPFAIESRQNRKGERVALIHMRLRRE